MDGTSVLGWTEPNNIWQGSGLTAQDHRGEQQRSGPALHCLVKDVLGIDFPIPVKLQEVVKKADKIMLEMLGPIIPANNDAEIGGKKD